MPIIFPSPMVTCFSPFSGPSIGRKLPVPDLANTVPWSFTPRAIPWPILNWVNPLTSLFVSEFPPPPCLLDKSVSKGKKTFSQ